jgi:adenylyltransferase/sulfurtransferase
MSTRIDDRPAVSAPPRNGTGGCTRLGSATAVIVGCGGLGTVAAELLARAGVGHLRLVDDDRVEPANLAGQGLFDRADARRGRFKAAAAARRLARLGLDGTFEAVITRMDGENADRLIAGADLVLDGTDNEPSRHFINSACVRQGIPWVFAAVRGDYGLTATIIPGQTPCYACLFGLPGVEASGDACHHEAPGPTAHMVATVQVSQALSLLAGDAPEPGALIYVDVRAPHLERWEVHRPAQGCPACGGH